MKLTITSSHILPVLTFAFTMLILSGCKTAEAEQKQESGIDTVAVQSVSDKDVNAGADQSGKQTASKEKKQPKKKTVDKGPGEKPVPTEETKDKLEEMEDSLAPIKAIPTTPKT